MSAHFLSSGQDEQFVHTHMPKFIILAAMKGRFVSQQGNHYDNFQMMGYVDSTNARDNPKVGLAQCSGAGDVTTVHILTK